MKSQTAIALLAGAAAAVPIEWTKLSIQTTGKYTAVQSTDAGLPKHTIYMPSSATEKLPVLVWGNGGCSGDGTSFKPSLMEVASHGYLAVASGAPSGSGSTTYKMMIETLDWLDKVAGSGKYANVDKTRIAVAGQSCGGLEAYSAGVDKRIKTIGIMNSGQFSDAATAATVKTVTKPIFYFLGGSGDIAYKNGERDYKALKNIPRWKGNMAVSTSAAAHMATWRTANGGKFATAEVHWLDWLLKEDAAAKAFFTGAGATTAGWSVEKADLDKIA
ncbi:hypothetical protein BT63DRAFT_425905 [Microthyrium microscopicum]|uniref:Alpha/beta-hydrolase n=1 Tax=Microthyrium microscopicum TaxID=703497 RepID=A0A6A6UAY8_9PEZI|nr:hypothetical protein BT63DRAFT_425905 [Microthyrium microscopicum]